MRPPKCNPVSLEMCDKGFLFLVSHGLEVACDLVTNANPTMPCDVSVALSSFGLSRRGPRCLCHAEEVMVLHVVVNISATQSLNRLQ